MEKNKSLFGNNTKTKHFKTVVFINAFLTGAVIMALEMTGSRFLTPFFGSSVYTWASIISMVLLSLAAGYFLGGFLAEKSPNPSSVSLLILLSAFGILMVPVYYETLFNNLYDFFPDPKIGSFFAALLTLFVPLLILGMYSPFSVKLLSETSDKHGKSAGLLYAVSTVGSIVGTLGVTFILIPIIGSKSITFSLAFLTFLSALSLFFLGDKNSVSKKRIIHLLAFVLFIIFFIFIAFNTPIKNLLGFKKTESKYLLEKVESEYNTITIKQKGEYITMSFRKHQAGHIESKINLLNEYELPLSYSQLMPAGLLYQTHPKSLLMLGLGGGMVCNYIKRYYKKVEVTGVELDIEVIRLAKKYFGLKESSDFKVVNKDGRVFLNANDETYDVIMLDAYKGGYIPFHLCTKQFYDLVKEHLTKKGIVVLNLHRGSKLFNKILYTLNQTFRQIDFYASKTKGNVVVVAYNQPPVPENTLKNRADSLQKQYNFYHNLKDVYLHKKNIAFGHDELLTDDFAPVNFLNAIQEHNQK